MGSGPRNWHTRVRRSPECATTRHPRSCCGRPTSAWPTPWSRPSIASHSSVTTATVMPDHSRRWGSTGARVAAVDRRAHRTGPAPARDRGTGGVRCGCPAAAALADVSPYDVARAWARTRPHSGARRGRHRGQGAAVGSGRRPAGTQPVESGLHEFCKAGDRLSACPATVVPNSARVLAPVAATHCKTNARLWSRTVDWFARRCMRERRRLGLSIITPARGRQSCS